MQFLKTAHGFSFLFLFCFIARFAGAQTGGASKKYENNKYSFSFSYPGEYMLDKINDDEWIIHKDDKTWGIGFKILHLQGKSYESYINSLSISLFSALAKGYGLSATFNGTPERNPYGRYLVSGFEFDLFIAGSMGSGTGLEKLTNSWNLYLNIFRKTSQAAFVPDGIIIYDFRLAIDVDGHKLTKQVINSFEKTVVFKKAIVIKPVVTTVAKKKPVATTPVVNKPVATKPPVKPNSITKTDKPVSKPLIGKLTDPRDGGGTYHTVKISTQTWMSENLDVSTFLNGDNIMEAKTKAEWEKAGKEQRPAWCYYNNDSKNDDFGKLYNWYAVNDKRGLASKGWHVPSATEFTNLVTYLGGANKAHIKLKSTFGWNESSSESNESGFNGVPAGYCIFNGTFGGNGSSGCWWSSSANSGLPGYAEYLSLFYQGNPAMWNSMKTALDKSSGFSVRCVKD